MSMKQQHPGEIIQRCLSIEQLYEMGPDVVKELNPVFIKEFTEIDDDDVETTVNEFDWEYMLFSAPLFQFEIVFKKLEDEAKAIEKTKTSSILGIDGKPMKFKGK